MKITAFVFTTLAGAVPPFGLAPAEAHDTSPDLNTHVCAPKGPWSPSRSSAWSLPSTSLPMPAHGAEQRPKSGAQDNAEGARSMPEVAKAQLPVLGAS